MKVEEIKLMYGENAFQNASSIFDFIPILGDFLCKVGTLHQVLVVEEQFSNHKTSFEVDFALSVTDCVANVIAQRLFNGVCGFGVDY